MKSLFVLLTLFSVVALGVAPISKVPTAKSAYELDHHFSPAVAHKHRLGSVAVEGHTVAVGEYDFAVQGGAVGDHNIGVTLPDNAIIRMVELDVITQPVSGGNTDLLVSAVSLGDLRANTAKGTLTVGRFAGTPILATIATHIKLDGSKNLYLTVSGAALTAGKIKAFIDYVVSE